MKRMWFIAALSLSGAACVEANNPVQIVDVVPVSAQCSRGEGISLLSGSLNFDVSNAYITSLSLDTPLLERDEATEVAFFGEELVFNYESTNPRTSFSEESRPIFASVPVDADPEGSFLVVNLIGTKAAEKLVSVVPVAPDVMTLFASVKMKGKLASGRAVETNEVTFPIRITREGGCAPEQQPVGDGPCGNPGQDGRSFTCQ